MLGAMDAEDQEQIRRRQVRYLSAVDGRWLEAAPQALEIEREGKVTRHDRPMKVHHDAGLFTEEVRFPVGFDSRSISIRCKECSSSREIPLADKNIEIAKLPER
jgi:hypothetical protein